MSSDSTPTFPSATRPSRASARPTSRARCDGCGTARAVAFSCKHRGFCPSCTGRRMNNGA
ncbi:MAG: transposase zinc-binding domain-containing protein, partial [Myxococcota bacterium]